MYAKKKYQENEINSDDRVLNERVNGLIVRSYTELKNSILNCDDLFAAG